MKILLLAPHPFYQERGTPIAVDLLLQAFVRRGDSVDVLTYPEGEERSYGPTVRIFRVRAPRFLRGIRPGFSLKKLLVDAYMAPQAMRMAQASSYDVVHAVEEAAFMARRISAKLGIPYVFDMDSSMPRQIADKLPAARPLLPLMRSVEARAIRNAAAVVPMCDAIAEEAKACGATCVEVLRDISLLASDVPFAPERGFRQTEHIVGTAFLYVGNLEAYQGMDLLLEAFAETAPTHPDAMLVVVGGRREDVAAYREKAAMLGIGAQSRFLGPRPVADMPHLFHDADILVSPRTQGVNTPMKIYSYLDAGKPTLATRLPTHTQVLTDEVAMLAAPTKEAMAEGMRHLLEHPEEREALARNAKALAQSRYSFAAFEDALNRLYNRAFPSRTDGQTSLKSS
ncbi:MAG: glycosyltransferase family 4 protein [Verrucomicrobiota bacterium]|jgi:glycosyltransferase involved in cell wall biosynthesis|nr:glycosyltransferase family 4 protein [Verrucomicrobiota bacterium]